MEGERKRESKGNGGRLIVKVCVGLRVKLPKSRVDLISVLLSGLGNTRLLLLCTDQRIVVGEEQGAEPLQSQEHP